MGRSVDICHASELFHVLNEQAIAIMAIGVIPFLIFYYEAEDPESREWQIWTALKYEFITVIAAATVIVVMWVFLGKAEVRTRHLLVCPTHPTHPIDPPAPELVP